MKLFRDYVKQEIFKADESGLAAENGATLGHTETVVGCLCDENSTESDERQSQCAKGSQCRLHDSGLHFRGCSHSQQRRGRPVHNGIRTLHRWKQKDG